MYSAHHQQAGIDILKEVLDSNSEYVKWSSFIKTGFHPKILLNSAPLKVNQFIYKYFLSRYNAGIFCSATLTVNEEFTYFMNKTGLDLALLDHKIKEKIYPSPFYYSDQVKLFVYTNSLDVKEPAFIDEIAQQINKISIIIYSK